MTSQISIDDIIKENLKRNRLLDSPYNPITGQGSLIPRKRVSYYDDGKFVSYLAPKTMYDLPVIQHLIEDKSIENFLKKRTGNFDYDSYVKFSEELFNLRLDHDFEFYCFTCVKIPDKSSDQIIPFKLNRSQRRLIARYDKMRIAGVPIRLILAKARQWGGSTATQIYMNWIQLRHRTNWNMAICTLVNAQAAHIRQMLDTTIDNFPPSIAKYTLLNYAGFSTVKQIDERGCLIGVGSTQAPDNLRTYNIHLFHACLSLDTFVPVKDGFLKRAKDLREGDQVITHTGKYAKIATITTSIPGEHNGNGKAISLTPWLGKEIILTPNHPVFTKRGWVNAGNLVNTDMVSMPVRPITNEITSITLPETPHRKQNGGSVSAGSGAVIQLTEGIGYFFGYYLAQGSIKYQKREGRHPINIDLSRHDDHTMFVDKAIIPVLPYIKSHSRIKRKGTLTTMEHLYGSSLSLYVDKVLKTKEEKVIPDWVFNAGEEFLTGLLNGYLSGDGSKTFTYSNNKKYMPHRVSVSSVSSSLAMQIRDIAASLGYGWASISQRNSGQYYGRNCKEIFTVAWNGQAAREIRELMGLEVVDNGRKCVEKYILDNNLVWMKIRSIKNTTIDKVIDIEADHCDHSFRTFCFSVKNSEVGSWEDLPKHSAKGLMQTLRGTIKNEPYTMIVLESTAKGVGNLFHREWSQSVEGKSGYENLFVPWFDIEMYREKIKDVRKFINILDEKYSDDGKTFWYLWELGATLEGINWYRNHKARENMDDISMFQEFPSNADEAFSSTGRPAFTHSHIKRMEANCEPPLWKGELVADDIKGKGAFVNLRFVESAHGNLWVWSMPDNTIKIKGRYCSFSDIGGKSKGADFSCTNVLDRYWMIEGGVPEVAAVWHGHIDQDLFAWKSAQLSYWYNKALWALEVNSLKEDNEDSEGDHFLTVLDEIADFYPNLYTRTNPEQIRQGLPVLWGYHTNRKTKPVLVDMLNAGLRDELYIEKDKRACIEMYTYELKENGTYGAKENCKDDHVIIKAGSLWLAIKHMPRPVEIIESGEIIRPKIVSEATI